MQAEIHRQIVSAPKLQPTAFLGSDFYRFWKNIYIRIQAFLGHFESVRRI